MVTAINIPETLSPTERTQLASAEETIKSGLKAFLTVGEQLYIIQQNKLYREGYKTFEDYMWQRWGIKKSAGYERIASFQFAENLKDSTPAEDVITTLKKSFIKILQRFPADLQVKLYNAALVLARTEDTDITSRHIKQAIQDHQAELDKQAVYASKYSPIIQQMNTGDLSPSKARLICETLSSLQPRVRGDMLRHQVTDTELMRLMDRKSKTNTYAEAITTDTYTVTVYTEHLADDYHIHTVTEPVEIDEDKRIVKLIDDTDTSHIYFNVTYIETSRDTITQLKQSPDDTPDNPYA